MVLQSSGAISLNDMHVEAGGASGTQCTINDADIRGLISKGSGSQMSFNEWYGASSVITEYGGDPQYDYMTATGDYPFYEAVVQDYYNNYPTVYAIHFDINYGAGASSEVYLTRRGVEAGWGSSPSYNIPYDWPNFRFPYQTSGGQGGQDASFLYTWNDDGSYIYRGGPQHSPSKNVFIGNGSSSDPRVDPNKIQFPAFQWGDWYYFFKANDPGLYASGYAWGGFSFPIWRTTSSTYPF